MLLRSKDIRANPYIKLFLSLTFTPLSATGATHLSEIQVSTAVIGGTEDSTILNLPSNPHNSVLMQPYSKTFLEIRPNFKWNPKNFELVLRPRATAELKRIRYKSRETSFAPSSEASPTKTNSETDTKVYLGEGFIKSELTNTLEMTFGRQNYQWGAAEVASPSNFIFHETVADRKVFYEAQGRDIWRLNYTPSKSWSTVAMVEWNQNPELTSYGDGNEFKPALLIKNEISWNSGAEYMGIVVGGTPAKGEDGWENRLRWGEFFNILLPHLEGYSFYGDISHQKGSAGWYPVLKPSAASAGSPSASWVQFEKKNLASNQILTTAAFGLRYDFVDGEIFRAEYAIDQNAYTHTERALAQQATAPNTPEGLAHLPVSLARYWNPGADQRSLELLYTSLYLPDLFKVRDLNSVIRYSLDPSEHSTWGYLSLQYQVGDAGTLSYGGMISTGRKNSWLRGPASMSHTVGYRHDW